MPHKYIPTFAIEKFGSRLLSGRFSLILCCIEWLLPSIWTLYITALSTTWFLRSFGTFWLCTRLIADVFVCPDFLLVLRVLIARALHFDSSLCAPIDSSLFWCVSLCISFFTDDSSFAGCPFSDRAIALAIRSFSRILVRFSLHPLALTRFA
jgi:hypothetical protein